MSTTDAELEKKAHLIIHGCAAASAAAAAAWSSVPVVGPFSIVVGADSPVLISLAGGMIVGLGALFGHDIQKATAMSTLGTIAGFVFGISIVKGLLSFIPGAGTIICTTTAAGVQEIIGWAFYNIFKEGKDPTKMSPDQLMAYIRREQENQGKKD